MNAVKIGYALAKQVPAMRQEVRLYTACGELLLQGAAAERVARVVERVLYARLRKAANKDQVEELIQVLEGVLEKVRSAKIRDEILSEIERRIKEECEDE